MVNLNSGLVLSVVNNRMTQGARIVQEPDQNKANSQLWKQSAGSTVAIAQPAQDAWAGYSAYRTSGGYVNNVVATWTVPAVNCLSNPSAGAAVWAGIWGSAASYFSRQDAWLAQIGTESLCQFAIPRCLLIWEMFGQVPGASLGSLVSPVIAPVDVQPRPSKALDDHATAERFAVVTRSPGVSNHGYVVAYDQRENKCAADQTSISVPNRTICAQPAFRSTLQ